MRHSHSAGFALLIVASSLYICNGQSDSRMGSRSRQLWLPTNEYAQGLINDGGLHQQQARFINFGHQGRRGGIDSGARAFSPEFDTGARGLSAPRRLAKSTARGLPDAEVDEPREVITCRVQRSVRSRSGSSARGMAAQKPHKRRLHGLARALKLNKSGARSMRSLSESQAPLMRYRRSAEEESSSDCHCPKASSFPSKARSGDDLGLRMLADDLRRQKLGLSPGPPAASESMRATDAAILARSAEAGALQAIEAGAIQAAEARNAEAKEAASPARNANADAARAADATAARNEEATAARSEEAAAARREEAAAARSEEAAAAQREETAAARAAEATAARSEEATVARAEEASATRSEEAAAARREEAAAARAAEATAARSDEATVARNEEATATLTRTADANPSQVAEAQAAPKSSLTRNGSDSQPERSILREMEQAARAEQVAPAPAPAPTSARSESEEIEESELIPESVPENAADIAAEQQAAERATLLGDLSEGKVTLPITDSDEIGVKAGGLVEAVKDAFKSDQRADENAEERSSKFSHEHKKAKFLDKLEDKFHKLEDKKSKFLEKLGEKLHKVEDKFEDKKFHKSENKFEDKFEDKKFQKFENKFQDKSEDKKFHKFENKFEDKFEDKKFHKFENRFQDKFEDKKFQKSDDKFEDKKFQKFEIKFEDKFDDKKFQKFENKFEDKFDDKNSKFADKLEEKISKIEDKLDDKNFKIVEKIEEKLEKIEEKVEDKVEEIVGSFKKGTKEETPITVVADGISKPIIEKPKYVEENKKPLKQKIYAKPIPLSAPLYQSQALINLPQRCRRSLSELNNILKELLTVLEHVSQTFLLDSKISYMTRDVLSRRLALIKTSAEESRMASNLGNIKILNESARSTGLELVRLVTNPVVKRNEPKLKLISVNLRRIYAFYRKSCTTTY